jgi:hypothetical protein
MQQCTKEYDLKIIRDNKKICVNAMIKSDLKQQIKSLGEKEE